MDMKIETNPNRAIVFHAKIRPRILEGRTNKAIARKDLKIYNRHLYKVFTATPLIDDSPPYLKPYNYVNVKKLKTDCDRLETIDKQNKMLLGKINSINRSKPIVDCWNNYCRPSCNNRMVQNNKLKRTMVDNLALLSLINEVSSDYSERIMKKHWKQVTGVFEDLIHMRKVLHIQKSLDQKLSEESSLTSGLTIKYNVPKKRAFLDFSIKNGVRLGQIVIELYQDHAPKIVKNFLAHCDEAWEYSYKNCRIHYGQKGKFFSVGDVILQNGKGGNSIFNGDFAADDNELKQTRPGLLVAVPIFKPAKFDRKLSIKQRIKMPAPEPKYNSQFAITVCRNNLYKGNAIIFGKIVKGNKVVNKINDMLKKCGTPLVNIVISRCGRIPYTKAELEEWQIARYNMIQEGVSFDDDSFTMMTEEENQKEIE